MAAGISRDSQHTRKHKRKGKLLALRGVVGDATWLVGSMRPDIAARTCILRQKLGTAAAPKLVDESKLVARIRDLASNSWSHDDDLKTQAGVTTTQDDRNIQNEVCAAKMTHSVLERQQPGHMNSIHSGLKSRSPSELDAFVLVKGKFCCVSTEQ